MVISKNHLQDESTTSCPIFPIIGNNLKMTKSPTQFLPVFRFLFFLFNRIKFLKLFNLCSLTNLKLHGKIWFLDLFYHRIQFWKIHLSRSHQLIIFVIKILHVWQIRMYVRRNAFSEGTEGKNNSGLISNISKVFF